MRRTTAAALFLLALLTPLTAAAKPLASTSVNIASSSFPFALGFGFDMTTLTALLAHYVPLVLTARDQVNTLDAWSAAHLGLGIYSMLRIAGGFVIVAVRLLMNLALAAKGLIQAHS